MQRANAFLSRWPHEVPGTRSWRSFDICIAIYYSPYRDGRSTYRDSICLLDCKLANPLPQCQGFMSASFGRAYRLVLFFKTLALPARLQLLTIELFIYGFQDLFENKYHREHREDLLLIAKIPANSGTLPLLFQEPVGSRTSCVQIEEKMSRF
jgi:hypothetical protein